MARIFALGDLHLSLCGDKPMDRFGEMWVDHARRMAENWDAVVGPDDTVLVAGDISWARNLDEAAPDLDWLAARPGRKLLQRGNHDSWWAGAARVREALPPCCEILHHDAARIPGYTVFGARGWTAPDDPTAVPGDEKIYRKELARLQLSVEAADRLDGGAAARVALLHFPPWLVGRDPTEVVPILEAAGTAICIYGHLHGDDHRLARTGRHGSIEYRFVAVDAVGFTPVELGLP